VTRTAQAFLRRTRGCASPRPCGAVRAGRGPWEPRPAVCRTARGAPARRRKGERPGPRAWRLTSGARRHLRVPNEPTTGRHGGTTTPRLFTRARGLVRTGWLSLAAGGTLRRSALAARVSRPFRVAPEPSGRARASDARVLLARGIARTAPRPPHAPPPHSPTHLTALGDACRAVPPASLVCLPLPCPAPVTKLCDAETTTPPPPAPSLFPRCVPPPPPPPPRRSTATQPRAGRVATPASASPVAVAPRLPRPARADGRPWRRPRIRGRSRRPRRRRGT
jgi:hypothetical protein